MKIVTLSTYPFAFPRHGGQHRLANIADQYRQAGHSVASVGVQGSGLYALSPNFIPHPPQRTLARYIENTFLMEDWAIGQWAAGDDEAYESLAALIPPAVDVLHIEQPWLFQFARRYAQRLSRKTVTLLYGSQNIEHTLKAGIVETYLGSKHAQECAALVKACELEAIANADLVCTVSREDADWTRKHTQKSVVLAPNGVARRSIEKADFVAANRFTRHHKYALYCASAHPPNIAGFYEMFGQGIGCLAPNQRLVVAGSAGPAIQSADQYARTPGLAHHLAATGEVSEEVLTGLLHLAHAMVLPITLGGGTNLKTAEALWAGLHVVATPVAMRGFEQFMNSPGVTVVESAVQFRAAMRIAMAMGPLELSSSEREARSALLWDSSLRPLLEKVNKLGAKLS